MLAEDFLGVAGLWAVAASTAIFDVLSYAVMYKMEKAEAERLNKKLREIAEKAEIAPKEPPAEPTIEAFGDKDARTRLAMSEILYFEADGELLFAYTASEIYRVKLRLYQAEELARGSQIIRVSKSHLVNVRKIQSVRPAFNSRLFALMPNGEEILVSRKYAGDLKAAMH